MQRKASKVTTMSARLPAAIAATAMLMVATSGQALAAGGKEIYLATPAQALTYCQSGNMPANDVAYIAGGPGLVQYGPGNSCAQSVPKKAIISKAIKVHGKNVSECFLVGATKAVTLCNDGAIGTYDIDYISGPVGHTLSGPGYGCTVNYSTSSIGTAVCK